MMIRLHLDLEDTVINDWSHMSILPSKITAIREFGELLKAEKDFGIFSFAIWDEKDRKRFRIELQDVLERTMGGKCISDPTIEEIMRSDARLTKTLFSRHEIHEFVSMRGKPDAFRNMLLQSEATGVHILVDDVVQNTIFQKLVGDLTVVTIDINDLVRWGPESVVEDMGLVPLLTRLP